MLNYNITTKASLSAKKLVVLFFIITIGLLILLWGISWFSALLVAAYSLIFICFLYSLKSKPFQCLLADNGLIEVTKPSSFIGHISGRSFYNAWLIFLCIEEHDPLLIHDYAKHNKSRKWFVVFNDAIEQKHYRLIARLIMSARRA